MRMDTRIEIYAVEKIYGSKVIPFSRLSEVVFVVALNVHEIFIHFHRIKMKFFIKFCEAPRKNSNEFPA